jgi:hypothetical protein
MPSVAQVYDRTLYVGKTAVEGRASMGPTEHAAANLSKNAGAASRLAATAPQQDLCEGKKQYCHYLFHKCAHTTLSKLHDE